MSLKLYMRETCPYCRKVISEIETERRTDIEFHDIEKNEEDRLTLVNIGGKQQVPCLFVDGTPMYESDDIIRWLKSNPQ